MDSQAQPTLELTGAALDTLIALVEGGPLWDGDLPSKQGRDQLVELGLAVRVVVRGEEGYQAATQNGAAVYKERYGQARTIRDAMKWRREQRDLKRREQEKPVELVTRLTTDIDAVGSNECKATIQTLQRG